MEDIMPEEKKQEKEDFLYIVRVANSDLKGERRVDLALADIVGIGPRLAKMIVRILDISARERIGDLKEDQIEKIREFIEKKEYEELPVWALNHRNEPITGTDYNLVSNDLSMQIQDDINYMKKMKSYKGIRHETNHKVRGQRTRSNGRRGLSMGVTRKREGT